MPYTRITKTKSASASIDYLRGHDKGHNGYLQRNQMVSGVNMLPDGAMPFEVQMAKLLRHKSSRNKTEGWRVIQSFGPGELDADEPSDVAKAHEIGCRLAEAMWPGFQVAVFTQSDGKGHKLHNHLFVCNVNTETYKGCDHNQTFHPRIKEKSDEICAQFFDSPEQEKADDKVPQTVRAKREINAERWENGEPYVYIWQDDLKDRIYQAAQVSVDFEDFQEQLVERGVEIDIKKPTKAHPERVITYELVDTTKFDDTAKIPRNLKCRSYKLGADYEYPTLEEQFAENNKMTGRGIEVSSEVFDAIFRAEAEEARRRIEDEEEEEEKTTEAVVVPADSENEAPEEGLKEVSEGELQADTSETKDEPKEEPKEKQPLWMFDPDGSKRLSVVGKYVRESIKRQFHSDDEATLDISARFMSWYQDRLATGEVEPFYALANEGTGLGISQKILDARVNAFRRSVMADLDYHPVYTDVQEERSDDPNERRRMALAKKARLEQQRKARMDSLTYDANEMLRGKKSQSDDFTKV